MVPSDFFRLEKKKTHTSGKKQNKTLTQEVQVL